MARTAELILRLVDQVTGPAKAINGALRTVDRATQTIQNVSRNTRRAANDMAGLSVPMLFLGRQAAEQVYAFEKAGNAAVAYGDITEAERERLEKHVAALNVTSPFNQVEIMEGANELFRAGLDFEQAYGALQGVLDLAAAGDIDLGTAGDLSTNILTSLRLPMQTADEVESSLLRVNDVLAYAAANSNADVLQLAESFKYAGGIATATNIEMDELAAIFMTLANNGIKGSEAGVALRSGIVRMLRPTSFARAALERLNIDMGEFVTLGDKIDATDISNAVKNFGADIVGLQPQIQKLLDDDILRRKPLDLVNRIMELITKNVGGDAADMQVLGEAVSEAIMSGAENVDFIGFIEELNRKGAGAVDLSQIWDVRQGSRLIGLLTRDLRALQEEIDSGSGGASARMAAARLAGIVGTMERFEAATSNLYMAVADAGVLDTVTNIVEAVSELIVHLSEVNPQLLEFGTYGLAALAALAPLGWIISGIAGALAFLTSPLTIAAGALALLAWQNWNGVTYFLDSFGRFFKESLSPEAAAMIDGMVQSLRDLGQSGSDMMMMVPWSEWGKNAGKAFAGIVNKIPELVAALPGIVDGFRDLGHHLQPVIEPLSGWFSTFATTINKIASAAARIAVGAFEGIRSFIGGFAESLDPATITSLQNFAKVVIDLSASFWKLVGSIADGVLAEENLGHFKRGLEGLGGFSADTLDVIIGAVQKLIDAIQWLANTDGETIGRTLMQGLVDGLVAGIPGLKGVISNIQSLQYALTGGRAGALPNYSQGSSVDSLPVPSSAYTGPGPDMSVMDIPQHAKGGAYQPGLIMTGEKGPELQFASGRGQIFTADETRKLLSGAANGNGGGDIVNFYVTGSNAEEIVDKVMAKLNSRASSKLQRSRETSMQGRLTHG